MAELSCILDTCIPAFAADPLGSASLLIFGAIILASGHMIMRNGSIRSRIRWSYPLVFSALFLLAFFSFSMQCHLGPQLCGEHAVLYSIPAAVIGSLIFGYLVLPHLYLAWVRGRRADGLSSCLPSAVPVYVADSGKPFAFSYGGFRRWIVVSQGMLEILTQNELQAVLLHEYGHIAGNASLYGISRAVYSKIPLLHAFLDGKVHTNEEEDAADRFAVQMQGSAMHLDSAKRKLNDYFSC